MCTSFQSMYVTCFPSILLQYMSAQANSVFPFFFLGALNEKKIRYNYFAKWLRGAGLLSFINCFVDQPVLHASQYIKRVIIFTTPTIRGKNTVSAAIKYLLVRNYVH